MAPVGATSFPASPLVSTWGPDVAPEGTPESASNGPDVAPERETLGPDMAPEYGPDVAPE